MATRTLEITFIGNPKPVTDSFEKMSDSGAKLSGKLSGLSSAFSGVASVAGGFVLGNAIMRAPAILGGLKDTARDLELQLKKQTVVFAEQLPVVQKWAEGNAAAMGLSKSQATNLAAGLADLLIPMGMTREAAAKMSTETLGLAGALAEWSGGQKNAAEVADILTKAYLGETDGLKALGISISAADVEARLALKGQKALTGAAMDQAKALAIQELIFEKSTDAQTAYAEGAGSAARKQAELTAKMTEAKEKLATGLMPVFTAFATLLASALIPALDLAGDAITKVSPWFATFSEILVGAVKNFRDINEGVIGAAGPWGVFQKILAGVVGFLVELAGTAWGALKDGAGALVSLSSATWDKLEGPLKSLSGIAWQAVKDGAEAIGKLAGLAWDAAEKAFKAIADFAKSDVLPRIEAAATAMKNIAETNLAPLIQQVKDLAAQLKESGGESSNWANAWDKTTAALKPAKDALAPIVNELLASLGRTLPIVVDGTKGLADAFKDLWEAVKPLHPVLEPLAKIIGGALVLALASVLLVIKGVVDTINLTLTVAFKWFEGLIRSAAKEIELLTDAAKGVTAFFQEWAPKLGRALGDVEETIKATVKFMVEFFEPLMKIGEGIIDGIVSGMNAGKDKLLAAAKAVVGFIEGAIPDWIPRSPSKAGVLIGQGFIHGISKGIEDTLPALVAPLADLAKSLYANVPDYVRKLMDPEGKNLPGEGTQPYNGPVRVGDWNGAEGTSAAQWDGTRWVQGGKGGTAWGWEKPRETAGGGQVGGGVSITITGPVSIRSQDEANQLLTTAARAAGLI